MFPSPDRILSRLVKDHFSPPTHPREVPREVPQNITRYFHGKNEGLSENTTNLMAYHRVQRENCGGCFLIFRHAHFLFIPYFWVQFQLMEIEP